MAKDEKPTITSDGDKVVIHYDQGDHRLLNEISQDCVRFAKESGARVVIVAVIGPSVVREGKIGEGVAIGLNGPNADLLNLVDLIKEHTEDAVKNHYGRKTENPGG